MAKVRGIVGSTAVAIQRYFLAMQQTANSSAAGMLKMAGAAQLLSVAGLLLAVKGAAKFGSAIDDNSQRLGVGAEAYQELSYAAKLAGVEQEDFQKSLEQMAKRLGEVKLGGSEAEKALGKIGLKMSDLKGKSPTQAFHMIADGVSRISDPMQKAAVAAEFFGRSGVKLIPILNGGSAGLNKMAAEARALGFVLSQDTIDKAAKLDDEFDRLGLAAKVAGVNLSIGFLPAATQLRQIFTSTDFQEGIRKTGENLGAMVKLLIDNAPAVMGVVAGLAAFKVATGITKSPLAGILAGGAAGFVVYDEATKNAKKSTMELTPEVEKLWMEQEKLINRMESIKKHKLGDTENNMIKEDQADYAELGKRLDTVRGKIDALQKTQAEPTAKIRTRIDVTDNETLRVATKALEDLQFKTKVAKGEFKGLGEGFPEFAHGLKLFGVAGAETATKIEKLPPALKKLHDGFLLLKGAQTTKENQTALQKMNADTAQLDMQLAAGAITADTYARAIFKIRDAYRQTTGIGIDLQGVAKGIGDAFGTAFENAIVDAKSLQEVLQALYKDILRVMVRKLISEPIGAFLTAGIGGAIGVPGKAIGGPVKTGHLYEVGERGRELFAPGMSGTVIPSRALKDLGPGGGGLTYAPTIDMRGAEPAAVARMETVLRQHSRQLMGHQRAMANAVHSQSTGVHR